jgi:hypothetical protein
MIASFVFCVASLEQIFSVFIDFLSLHYFFLVDFVFLKMSDIIVWPICSKLHLFLCTFAVCAYGIGIDIGISRARRTDSRR